MEEDLTPPAVEMKGWVEERSQEDALWRRCKGREGDGGGGLDLSMAVNFVRRCVTGLQTLTRDTRVNHQIRIMTGTKSPVRD